METAKDQIFNLWNTNGRRHDVLNALKSYLEILCEIKEEYPQEQWSSYPESIAEFLFYRKAIEYSPDVFREHKKYDAFVEKLGEKYDLFLSKNPKWILVNFSKENKKILDEGIEARARHYTSNLVKMGFADDRRNITEAGYSYLKNHVERDSIEAVLPLDDINLILLRQMLKLRVFSKPDENGVRSFYSPFFMAVLLLLGNGAMDKESFFTMVQGLNPYLTEEKRNFVLSNAAMLSESPDALSAGRSDVLSELKRIAWKVDVEAAEEFLTDEVLSFDVFNQYIRNQKSGTTDRIYYDFYLCLLRFRENKNEENYSELLAMLSENKEKLRKAFGYGKAVFDVGRNSRYGLEEFLEKNAGHIFLTSASFNRDFYEVFCKSGRIDDIKEYSDTTERILGATGLFKFSGLPELANGEAISLLFDKEQLKNSIFGRMTAEEYQGYEVRYRSDLTISAILDYNTAQIQNILEQMGFVLGVKGVSAIRARLKSKVSEDFAKHIEAKYPREKIEELLPLFSDRKNDSRIKKQVNDTANVPTIYEYIIGIAWYYISDKSFDLFDSLKLTLNGDFEPVIHAGAGDGDIVIHYDDFIVMLEVTLMNKQAQKRGEWEPVLRHSLNLKAANEPKETMTFFIADELDYNTINIWRAVAAVSLESTNTHKKVDGVIIMPFTNREILSFLEKEVPHTQIIEEVRKSFQKVPQITDVKWHEDVLQELIQQED